MLSNSVSKALFYGNNLSTHFPFTFKVWESSQLIVEVVNAQGVSEEVSPWAVELSEEGGTLTYMHHGSPLPEGYTLAILRNMPFQQEVQLISGTRFDPSVIESQLDKATAERQQLKEVLARSVKVPSTANYTADDILKEIYLAQSESKSYASSAAQSEQNAELSAQHAAQYLQNTGEEVDKATMEADRAKAEADRAAMEANVAVDGITVVKTDQHALAVKTYALEDFTDTLTETEQNYPASMGSVANILSLPIGAQIAVRCSAAYIPEGCIPEDGAQYSKAQFPNLWDNYLITGLLQTCTYAEATAQIVATGACNAFAMDVTAQTFKAPLTPDGYVVQQALTNGELGEAYEAGLPNITGQYVVANNAASSLNSTAYGTGALTAKPTMSTNAANHIDYSGGGSGLKDIAIDASLSNPIYGNSDTVQPKAIALRHFVVVASGSINQSMMDWSAWATGLQGKASADLSNFEMTDSSAIQYKCIYGTGQAPAGDPHAIEDDALGNNGTIVTSTRYVLTNPFGISTPVFCTADVYVDGNWHFAGILTEGSYECVVHPVYVQNEGIVMQTTRGSVAIGQPIITGSTIPTSYSLKSAPCRIHVWKIGV